MKNPVLLLYWWHQPAQCSFPVTSKLGAWSLFPAACGATSPWAEAQPLSTPVVKWPLITQEKIAPNHCLSTAHFHKTQDSHTLLCNSFVGFCQCSFVVTSAALGGTQGSVFARSFSFPAVYINEVECCSVAEYQSPMAFTAWELLVLTNGFSWVFWDQMVAIKIIHGPKQIKGKLGTSSLDRGWNQRWGSFISFLLFFLFKTHVHSWHFWSMWVLQRTSPEQWVPSTGFDGLRTPLICVSPSRFVALGCK